MLLAIIPFPLCDNRERILSQETIPKEQYFAKLFKIYIKQHPNSHLCLYSTSTLCVCVKKESVMKLEDGKDREKVIRQADCHCQLSHANPAQRNITIKVLPSMQIQLFLLGLLRELNDQHFVVSFSSKD